MWGFSVVEIEGDDGCGGIEVGVHAGHQRGDEGGEKQPAETGGKQFGDQGGEGFVTVGEVGIFRERDKTLGAK